jgi:ribosomal peptide maturation radical SAM protein 1
MRKVVFVTMPFAACVHPSLGLSLIKATLERAGIESCVEYLNLDFACRAGMQLYGEVCARGTNALIGDWIFAGQLAPAIPARDRHYVEEFAAPFGPAFAEGVTGLRDLVEPFIERSAERILALRPRVVGFTSIFQQQVASLALAQRLKKRCPELRVIFGGANCESRMGAEVVRRFPFVDVVVSGEADAIAAELFGRMLEGACIDDLPGVYTRTNVESRILDGCPTAPAVLDMDALPYPDFSDFYDQVANVPSEAEIVPRLLFETSRGCWWGAKHHCTFCGLNGTTMRFRSKSSQRALDELQHLVESYGTTSIGVVDNILDMNYFNDFIPELTRRNLGLDLLYEVKANLTKEQIRALKGAGIRTLQPGVESLATGVLKLMDKGVRGLQNIQLLKWCKELGVTAAWNVLWGFPGEDPAEYEAMAAVVPLLSHLMPPVAEGTIRLDRFSPNFNRAEALGFANVRPIAPYEHVYPLDADALANLAYYFTFDYAEPRDVAGYTAGLGRAIAEWREDHPRSELLAIDLGETLLIVDYRPKAPGGSYVLDGIDGMLYRACDAATGIERLRRLSADRGWPMTRAEIESRLQPLLDAGLMVREGDAYLALAIALGEYVPGPSVYANIQALTAALLPAAV